MQTVHGFSFQAAILIGTVAAALPLASTAQDTDQQKQDTDQQKISLVAGHNVVDAVDDVRETTDDLVNSMLTAEEQFGYTGWEEKEDRMLQIKQDLEQMEVALDEKAEDTDSSWLNWMEDRDYTVTVKEQIGTLGNHLKELSAMLAEARGDMSLEVVVGHDMVDQVDDVRETTADLFRAINDAGPELGWFDDPELFADELAQLDEIEQELDRTAEMTDEEWETIVGSPEFRTMIHGDIATLGQMLEQASSRIRG